MNEFCVPDANVGLVRGLLNGVDCNVGGLVRTGYQSLSAPDSAVMLTLTAMLTLYVAFIGFRLLLGRSRLSVGDTALAALKVGVVLALATSWGSYQTVVYEALYTGPQAIAAGMLGGIQPQESAFRGSPIDGLQLAFDSLQQAAQSFADRAGSASPLTGGAAFGAMSLNGSAMLLLLSTLGLLLASKIVLALLLALAPAIAGLLLFDATRNMVAGWLKSMVALALVPLVATLVLAIELTMLESGLLELAQNRAAGQYPLAPAIEVGMLILVFTGVLLAAILSGVAIAKGIRLPWSRDERPVAAASTTAAASAAILPAPPRATRIAAAAAAVARREARMDAMPRASAADRRTSVVATTSRDRTSDGGLPPLGQSYRRRSQPRRTASGQRRDR